MQSRRESAAEAAANIAIGYGISLCSQMAIFPMVGVDVPMATNLWISAWFTGVSLIRTYAIRRWVNRRRERHG